MIVIQLRKQYNRFFLAEFQYPHTYLFIRVVRFCFMNCAMDSYESSYIVTQPFDVFSACGYKTHKEPRIDIFRILKSVVMILVRCDGAVSIKVSAEKINKIVIGNSDTSYRISFSGE